jgi:hypothetical protein
MASEHPGFRDFVKLLWDAGFRNKRALRRMGAVRRELLRVVHSPLTDEEAVRRIGDLVRGDQTGAKATLRYVSGIRDHSYAYDTDRACRLLVAAMAGAAPQPMRSQDAGLFDRERELGLIPLDQAFDQLMSAVPELEAVRKRAERLAGSPEAFVVERNAAHERIVVSGKLHSEASGDVNRLVGPKSGHHDALVRSSLARQVVSAYVTAILAGPDAALANRALWDGDRRRVAVRWSGSVQFG